MKIPLSWCVLCSAYVKDVCVSCGCINWLVGVGGVLALRAPISRTVGPKIPRIRSCQKLS